MLGSGGGSSPPKGRCHVLGGGFLCDLLGPPPWDQSAELPTDAVSSLYDACNHYGSLPWLPLMLTIAPIYMCFVFIIYLYNVWLLPPVGIGIVPKLLPLNLIVRMIRMALDLQVQLLHHPRLCVTLVLLTYKHSPI